LQSVFNPAARLIFNLRRSDHVSDAVISLHRLRVLERYQVQACRTRKVLHGCAPSDRGPFTYVDDHRGRRGLRSSCSDRLVQPPVHHSTVGSRAFSVVCVGPRVWNCLPSEVTSAPSLATFRTRLETFLFIRSHFLTFDSSDIYSTHCL